MTDKSFTSRPAWLVALIVITTYVILDKFYVGDTSRSLLATLAGDAPRWLRIIVGLFINYPGPSIILPAVITAVIVGQKNFLEVWGFDKWPWRGLGFAFFCCLPLPLVYIFAYPVADVGTMPFNYLDSAILPGFSEEVLYRCFLFGMLFRVAKWGFLPAALLGAVVFGAGHLYQGHAIWDSIGVFGITAFAALWWAWLYVEWDFNPWVIIGFHVFINGWFEVFTVSHTTLLPLAGEIARASVVVISVVLTVWMRKKQGGRNITGRLWFKQPFQATVTLT